MDSIKKNQRCKNKTPTLLEAVQSRPLLPKQTLFLQWELSNWHELEQQQRGEEIIKRKGHSVHVEAASTIP